jgi:diguanylate cyclase (GGDEF)-like protein
LLPLIVVLAIGLRDSPGGQRALAAISYTVIELLGLAFSVRAATHPGLDPAARRPWKIIAAGWVALLLAGLGFSASVGAGSAELSPALLLALACRAAFLVLLLRGLFLFDVRRTSRTDRLKLVLDVTTVAGAAVIITWYLLTGPAVARAVASPPWVVATVYTVGDLVLVFGVCAVLLRGTATSARLPLALLLAGCICFLADDVRLAYTSSRGSPLSLVGTVWITLSVLAPLFLLMLAAAAQVRQAERHEPVRAQPLIPRPTWLPFTALMFGFSLLVIAAVRSPPYPWWGLVGGAVLTAFAVTARQVVALRENHTMVVTDSLTGLASRASFKEALHRANDRGGPLVALLHVDLDDFKQINDVYGHDIGDAYLSTFAATLHRVVGPADTAARIGGDEFSVVMPKLSDPDQAIEAAEKVLADSALPADVDGHRLRIRASVGIAVAKMGMADDAEIMRWADQAMYAAKRRRSHGWYLYVRTTTDDVNPEEHMIDDIGHTGDLRCTYQPIVSLHSYELVAVEAQGSWRRSFADDDSWLMDTDLPHETGQRIIEEAVRHVACWRRELPPDRQLRLAMRLSSQQLASLTLADDITHTLDRYGMPPPTFVAEVVESELPEDDSAIAQLVQLHQRGVRIAVEGSGSACQSLRYLNRRLVDTLKLDCSFVTDVGRTPAGSAIAMNLARLARILQVDSAAAGVQTLVQASELARSGYQDGQGDLFAPPLTGAEMDELIAAARPRWPAFAPPDNESIGHPDRWGVDQHPGSVPG